MNPPIPARLALIACAWMMLAGQAAARTLEVGPGRPYTLPSQAVAAAQDGDRILIAPGRYADCAVVARSGLVIEGAGPDTVITGHACQGKALLVIAGNDVLVRNMTLTGAQVPDGNGAGIRMEGRNLTVERVHFVDNENGILTVTDPHSVLLVRDSEFTHNGGCEGRPACAHGIYSNPLALLRVEGSTFRDTREGHHIKSRALRTEIVDCDIADGAAGTASYLVDIPNGGDVLIRGNRMQKGPGSENQSAAISIGAEGGGRPSREILIADNQFRKDGPYATAFTVNRTAGEAMLRGNRLEGVRIRPLRGGGVVAE